MRHLFMAVLLGFAVQASASNYPPDYPIHTDQAKASDNLQVSRRIGWDWVGLGLTYSGPLTRHALAAQGKLRVWVKLNGHEATFPLKYYYSAPRGPVYFVANISSAAHSCTMAPGGGTYVCEKPTPEMQHLLYWAKPNHSGVNANAWDVEMAFYIEGTDQWDNYNGFGGNYRVHFDQYGF